MEIIDAPRTNRITLRLPNSIVGELKKEANEKDIPLNALVTKFLNKDISYNRHVTALSHITVPHMLFMKMIDIIDEHYIEKIASKGPAIVRKLFKKTGMSYDLDGILNHYLVVISKYCGWYELTYENENNHYRLVFETNLGLKWTKFLSVYIGSILNSLDINMIDSSADENLIIFEFNKL